MASEWYCVYVCGKYGVKQTKPKKNSIHKLGYEFPHRKCHKCTDNSYAWYSHFLRRSIWVVFVSRNVSKNQMYSTRKQIQASNASLIALIGHFEAFADAVTFLIFTKKKISYDIFCVNARLFFESNVTQNTNHTICKHQTRDSDLCNIFVKFVILSGTINSGWFQEGRDHLVSLIITQFLGKILMYK